MGKFAKRDKGEGQCAFYPLRKCLEVLHLRYPFYGFTKWENSQNGTGGRMSKSPVQRAVTVVCFMTWSQGSEGEANVLLLWLRYRGRKLKFPSVICCNVVLGRQRASGSRRYRPVTENCNGDTKCNDGRHRYVQAPAKKSPLPTRWCTEVCFLWTPIDQAFPLRPEFAGCSGVPSNVY